MCLLIEYMLPNTCAEGEGGGWGYKWEGEKTGQMLLGAVAAKRTGAPGHQFPLVRVFLTLLGTRRGTSVLMCQYLDSWPMAVPSTCTVDSAPTSQELGGSCVLNWADVVILA